MRSGDAHGCAGNTVCGRRSVYSVSEHPIAAHLEEQSRFGNLHIQRPEGNGERPCARLCGESRRVPEEYCMRKTNRLFRHCVLIAATWKNAHTLAKCTYSSRNAMGTGDVHGCAGVRGVCRRNTVCGRQAVHSVSVQPIAAHTEEAHAFSTCAYGSRNTK